MTWAVRIALGAMTFALIRSLWVLAGPPSGWPARSAAWVRRRRERRRSLRLARGVPDPFEVLHMQEQLTRLAGELRRLEANDADLTYFARAHRVHTRRHAYDQLLAEACRMAGIRTAHAERADGLCRSEDERFLAETELAARGWHW